MTDCVEFAGCLSKDGYGKVHIHKRGVRLAHRAAWEDAHGSIPPGYDEHLELLTPAEHKGLHRKTHCKHGHEMTPENTYWEPYRGTRICRRCKTKVQAESYARRAARKKAASNAA